MAQTRTVSQPTINHETAFILEQDGFLTPVVNNKRKLSTSTLGSSSTGSGSSAGAQTKSRNITPAEAGEYTAGDFAVTALCSPEQLEAIEIPSILESLETLEFIGFTTERATEIWNRFSQSLDDPERDMWESDLLSWCLNLIENNIEAAQCMSLNDDWLGCLATLGINERLSSAIMSEDYARIRCTHNCRFWVMEAIEENFKALEGLNTRLKEKIDKGDIIKRPEKKKAKTTGPRASVPSLESPQSIKRRSMTTDGPSSAEGTPQPPSSAVEGEEEQKKKSPGETAAEADQQASVLSTTTLWRGTTTYKTTEFYIPQSGVVKTSAYASPRGDLSADGLTYWTPQRKVADIYAQYLKKQYHISEIVIVRVTIDESFVNSLGSPSYLWATIGDKMNPAFQEYVWNCRRGSMPPAKYLHYAESPILIANILSVINAKYIHMNDWRSIKKSDLLYTRTDDDDEQSELGIQWVFRTTRARAAFEEHCHGKVLVYKCGTYSLREDLC